MKPLLREVKEQVARKRKQRPAAFSSASTSTAVKRSPSSSSNTKKRSSSSAVSTGVCEHVSDRYEKVGRVGEGTYGIVYKARDKQTGDYVALKRCIPHHESSDGFPLTTLRELQTLKICQSHPNIVQLLNVTVSSTNGVFLVFDYCSVDLAQLLDSHFPKHRASPFHEAQVKTLTQQLLGALDFLHARALLHRDIKPSNLLYHQGQLQLADFGLARQMTHKGLTPNVVSLWYRSPELLWQKGNSRYTSAIDLWATGCVVAELLQGFPLLDGKTELEQMEKIANCLGMPPYGSDDTVKLLSNRTQTDLELWDRFDYLSKEGLGFLTMLLEYNPGVRWTARQALESEFFRVAPLPATEMPSFHSVHQAL